MKQIAMLAALGYAALIVWFFTRPSVYSSVWPFGKRDFKVTALFECEPGGADSNEIVVEVEVQPRFSWLRVEKYRFYKRIDLGMWFWDRTGDQLVTAPDHVWKALECSVQDRLVVQQVWA